MRIVCDGVALPDDCRIASAVTEPVYSEDGERHIYDRVTVVVERDPPAEAPQ